MSGDYKVGKGKPPVEHQFKKGKSGNPGGRPPKVRSGPTNVASVMDEPVTVTMGGRKRRMPSFEAYVRRLGARATKNLSAAIAFIKLCEICKAVEVLVHEKQMSGVVLVPASWDHDDFVEMLHRHGAPPFPGDRPGLPDRINPPKAKG